MAGNPFAKIATAQTTGGGNQIRDGIYKFLVEKVFIQSGHTGECFIAELRVMESAPNGELDPTGRPVTPNAVGTSASVICNLTQHESAAGNAKKFVVAALGGVGYTEDQVTPEVLAHVCSPENPLRGFAVVNETYRSVNKGRKNPANAGKPLTLNGWKSVKQDEGDIKSQKTYLDSTAAKADAAPAPMTGTTPAPGGMLGSILGMNK